jgi:hypothetical protein
MSNSLRIRGIRSLARLALLVVLPCKQGSLLPSVAVFLFPDGAKRQTFNFI